MVTYSFWEPRDMAHWRLFLKNSVTHLEGNKKELFSIKATMRPLQIAVVSLTLIPDEKSEGGSLIILQV